MKRVNLLDPLKVGTKCEYKGAFLTVCKKESSKNLCKGCYFDRKQKCPLLDCSNIIFKTDKL